MCFGAGAGIFVPRPTSLGNSNPGPPDVTGRDYKFLYPMSFALGNVFLVRRSNQAELPRHL